MIRQRILGWWLARLRERELEAEFDAQTEEIARTRRNPRKGKGGRLKRRWRDRAPVIASPEELAEIGPGDAAEPPEEHRPTPEPPRHPEPAQMPDNQPVRGRERPDDGVALLDAIRAEDVNWRASWAALIFLASSVRVDIARGGDYR